MSGQEREALEVLDRLEGGLRSVLRVDGHLAVSFVQEQCDALRAALAAREEPQDEELLAELRRGMAEHGFIVGRNPDGVDDTVAATLLVVKELLATREDTERPDERELYLARRVSPGSMQVIIDDGAHSDAEGVAKAAKLAERIFGDSATGGDKGRPWIMVEILPLPDLDPPINDDAAEACREMVQDTEQEHEG